MVIYKYRVSSDVDFPYGAEIVSFAYQEGVPYVWALVDLSEQKMVTRYFLVIGTGSMIPEDMIYRGTTHTDPPFVWHLFESA